MALSNAVILVLVSIVSLFVGSNIGVVLMCLLQMVGKREEGGARGICAPSD